MSDEHEPMRRGLVKCDGDVTSNRLAKDMMGDVETHGHVHAEFKDTEGHVEVSLGTVFFDFGAGAIKIWDGDHYVPYSMDHLVTWEKPMEVTEAH